MTQTGQTVALCMIVKNEAHVLERCLRSVLPFIDSWLIVDTGSSDGTQGLACDVLKDLPGRVVERPWCDFGRNRSEAMALACSMADYVLTLDADEFLQVDPGFSWPSLLQDAYTFVVNSGGVLYSRIQFVSSSLPWRYEGVLHEYITADRPHTQAELHGVTTMRLLEGARSRDPLTYLRDAEILESAIHEDPGNARHVFYLAQSYRDAHRYELALERYRQRAAMGGFPEEVWCSLYETAKLLSSMATEWPTVQEAFLEAYRYRPTRAEPLYRIGLELAQQSRYEEAFRYLSQAMQLPLPATAEAIFLETDVYQFLVPLEYSVVCFWLERHEEAILIIDGLLSDSSLSTKRRELLLRNRECSVAGLAG